MSIHNREILFHSWYLDLSTIVVLKVVAPPPPPPPPDNFKGRNLPLYIIGKGIYRRVRFILDIDKIFWFRDFMSNFYEMTLQKFQKKISNF